MSIFDFFEAPSNSNIGVYDKDLAEFIYEKYSKEEVTIILNKIPRVSFYYTDPVAIDFVYEKMKDVIESLDHKLHVAPSLNKHDGPTVFSISVESENRDRHDNHANFLRFKKGKEKIDEEPSLKEKIDNVLNYKKDLKFGHICVLLSSIPIHNLENSVKDTLYW